MAIRSAKLILPKKFKLNSVSLTKIAQNNPIATADAAGEIQIK